MNTELPEPYFFGTAYLMLKLSPELFANIPETMEVFGNTLYRKKEFHISLLCLKALVPMIGDHAEFSDANREQILSIFSLYVREHPIQLSHLEPEFRYVTKDERKSLIVRADVSNLSGFLSLCENALGISMPVPPTHVTLYAFPADTGIGVNTPEAWDALARVELPQVKETLIVSA